MKIPDPVADDRGARSSPAWPVLVGGAAVLLAAGLQAMAWLVGPVMLALVVVLTVRPVEGWLRGRGMPRWAAATVLVVLVYAVVLVLAGVIVVSLARLVTVLPEYRAEANALVGTALDRLREFGVGPVGVGELAASVDLGRVAGILVVVLSGVAGLAGNLVFLFSVMLFLAIESGGVRAKLDLLTRMRPAKALALTRFVGATRRFLVVTTVFGLITAAVDTVILLALGVPLAVLWGLLAFITNYIPYVGFFIGVVPPAVLALLEGGWARALVVVVIYVVVNFVLCSLVQPRFVGDAVGLSLIVVFLSLGFWAWILGPLGAVLAVPLTLLVKALLIDGDPRAAWMSELLGAGPPAPAGPPTAGPPTADPPTAGDATPTPATP